MQQFHRGNGSAFLSILMGFILAGCASGPILARNDMRFGTEKFSVDSPPDGWASLQDPKAVLAWQNKVTKSRISIRTSVTNPISSQGKVDIMTTALKVSFREKFKESRITLERQNQMTVNGRKFHRAIWHYDATPMQGLRVSGKIHAYFLKTIDFDVVITFVTVLGAFEKDHPVLENVLRSLSIQG